jgi:DNA-binding IclR family transcriptional regulator
MRNLVEKTNLTCHLAILDGPEAVYIEKVEPTGFIRMDTWVGRRMRVHATSVGKALTAHIPQQQLENILAERAMERRTPKTICTLPRLLKELEKCACRDTPSMTRKIIWEHGVWALPSSTSRA